MEQELAAQQESLDGGTGDMDTYCELLERYTNAGGYEVENQIQRELEKFGFSSDILERDFQTLSGGEQTCMFIIALFLRKDPFVMLDEPTNHLDVDKRKQLCDYLKKKKGFILVTHDYEFLDQVVDHILAINKADITLEQGNYSTWKRNMLQKEEHERKLQEELIKEVSALEDRAEQSRGWAEVGNKQKYPYKTNARANGNRAYMQRAKRSEHKILDDIEQKKMLLRNIEEEKSLSLLRQIENEESILHFEGLSFSYDQKRYLFKTQLRKALVEQAVTLIFVEHDREFGKAVATKTLYL